MSPANPSAQRESGERGKRRCVACDHDQFEAHLGILQRCTRCHFVFADVDGGIDFKALYGDGYFHGDEYLDYSADEIPLKMNFRRRLADVLRYKDKGLLLEIGSAYGFFLDLARSFDTVGFEMNDQGAQYGRERFGLDIRTTSFLDVRPEDLGGRKIDVAILWDVIEHVDRPDLYIEHLAKLSNPGAMLFITTGDIGSLPARLRGRKWRMIHPPTHLHYFSRHSLRVLVERYGYKVEDLRSIGVTRSYRQILHSVLCLNLGWPGLYRWSTKWVKPEWSFTVDLHDIMQLTARLGG